jgi:hypothetical protein
MSAGDRFLDDEDADTVMEPGGEVMEKLKPAPASAPVAVPQPRATSRNIPRLLSPTDTVPELRRELKLTRKVSGGFEVRDPATGQTLVLNEYELSLARMLNGKRPVAEVLAAGERLGIPVNLESLHKFIQHLQEQGLLAAPKQGEVAASAPPTWASRGEWESSVRAMFQSGIRLLRMGKPAAAAGYFEALLQEDPENIEARELLAMAKQAADKKDERTLLGPPVAQSSPPAAVAQVIEPARAMAHAAPTMLAPQMFPVQPPPLAPMAAPAPMAALAPAVWIAPVAQGQVAPTPPRRAASRYRRPVMIVAAVAAVAIGFLVWRGANSTAAQPAAPPAQIASGSQASEPAKPEPVKPEPVKPAVAAIVPDAEPAPEPATAEPAKPGAMTPEPPKPEVATAEPVKPGAKTADPPKPDVATAEPAKPGAKTAESPKPDAGTAEPAKADVATTEPAKPDVATTEPAKPEPAKPEPAKPHPAKPHVAATRVEAPAAGQITALLRGPRAVKKGETLFEIVHVTGDPAKIKELTDKLAEASRLAADDAMYEPFVADAKQALANARKVSTTVVKAPRSGRANPHVRQGANVHTGQLLAEIQ